MNTNNSLSGASDVRPKLSALIKDMCPHGVEFKTLGEVCKIERGVRVVRNELQNKGDIPVYQNSLTPLGYYHLSNTPAYTTFVISAGAAGKVGFSNIPFWAADDCLRITCPNYFNSRFLYYLLTKQQDYLLSQVRHASVPRMSKEVLAKLSIPLPPLEIQEKVVEILDKFSTLAAELQAELQMCRKQYEYYRTQLLTPHSDCNSATKSDDAQWEWKTLGEIASFKYGYTAKAKDLGNARYIRITDIDKNGCITQDAKYLDMTPEAKEYILQKGDVVMARTGATFGKTLYYNEDYTSVYASFLIKICLDSSIINSRYYWHFAQSQLYWEQANKLVGGGAQPQFNAGAVSQIQIPIPPLKEQARIVAILDKFEALTTSLSDGIPAEQIRQQKRYEYYRDLLLTFDRKAE